MRKSLTAVVLVAGIALSGCSMTPTLEKSKVEQEIKNQLTAKVGAEGTKSIESITCPGDLKGKVGETMTCDIKSKTGVYPTKVTVTKVENKVVSFDIEVADKPK